ncbi:MAG: acyl-CoA dehydrogenase family protein [Acidimicrobiales bacterium]|nr:acyl-CoA dehydrogenase family protein [Acidimicrobiales bacterium]
MYIGDTDEQAAAFRVEARAWLEADAVPKGHPDDFSVGSFGGLDEGDYVERARAWQRTLHDDGWAAPSWPEAAGGQGKPPICQSIFSQEQAAFGVTSGPFVISIGMVGPTILRHGSPAQQARYLPRILRERNCGANSSPSPVPAPTSPPWRPGWSATATSGS